MGQLHAITPAEGKTEIERLSNFLKVKEKSGFQVCTEGKLIFLWQACGSLAKH